MLDIYFNPYYGKICEAIDKGECCRYTLETGSGRILNQFIKRPLPFLIEGTQYYDIVTPYGYGGPVILESKDRDRLLEEYRDGFAAYCSENGIICEFVRYHPLIKNYEDFSGIYDTSYSRHTVGTNLRDYDDPVQSEFSKSARQEVRKCEKAGVRCEYIVHPSDLSVFRRIYEETMDRNHADAMYYFPDGFYETLTTALCEYILEVQAHIEGRIIASEIYFITDGIMHAHLLGISSEMMEIGGGAILEAAAARWGKENGYRYIHHGGGRSSADDDSLYLYKKKFGKHTTFDFYIGKKIWDPVNFDKAVEIRKGMGPIENAGYFPAYRG